MNINFPVFESDNKKLNDAYRIAVGDLAGNILYYKDGLLDVPAPCLMAGLDYNTPWTRDTAINVWNAMAVLSDEVSKNTLLSVLEKRDNKIFIGGQYWDAVIWIIGAYRYWQISDDSEFLNIIYTAALNSVLYFEETEFDDEYGLFRGPAVYGDGVAAYPDKYARCADNSSGITDWVKNPENGPFPKGYGIPMFALSTNCIYFRAYEIIAELCGMYGENPDKYLSKADKLKSAVNKHFWNEKTGNYDYLAGECTANEGMGLAFAILFGIADRDKAEKIYRNTYVTPNGIACVWPAFERYTEKGGFGRHSGTVWPHIQGFWAQAMLKSGKNDAFDNELYLMADKACRDMHFSEIYHPYTGERYGGLQENIDGSKHGTENEDKNGINEWISLRKQSWSASAFLSLIFYGILGLNTGSEEREFNPYFPKDCNKISVKNLKIGKNCFNITAEKNGIVKTEKIS